MRFKRYSAKKGLFALVMLWIALAQGTQATISKITGVRITTHPNASRFVLDVSPTPHYHLITENQRLLLTLDNAELVCALPKTNLIKTPVQDYQAKEQPNHSLQWIFNLKQPVVPSAYTLSPSGAHGYRLVLDLKSPVPKTQGNNKAKAKPRQEVSQVPKQSLVIVIDPGHGGKDPGATGVAGNREKEVVLSIAKILAKQLRLQAGYHVHLTRSRDEFIPLRQRLAIARKYKADLFVAIHADAAYQNTVNGASVFALSQLGATSEMARWLAEKENQSELVDGIFATKDKLLRSVLLDLSQTHTISVSLEMGQAILHRLSTVTDLHDARVEQAAFVVLKSPDIPSLLVETGYLSNPGQEKQLINPEYQQKIALAIAEGIQDYFVRHPPRSV